MSQQLYHQISQMAPAIRADELYTRDDLVNDAYLECTKRGIAADDQRAIKAVLGTFQCRRYRDRYPRHSTRNYTAEDLLTYCNERVLEPAPEPPPSVLYESLMAAFLTLGNPDLEELLQEAKKTI